jgi:RNA polymerase sigma-70 factor, ECF subfamily
MVSTGSSKFLLRQVATPFGGLGDLTSGRVTEQGEEREAAAVTDPREPAGATEEEWVLALKRREAWAWDRLQRAALDPVFAYVFLRCGRREDAEDLTAEVFASAVAAIDQFRGDCRIETWLIAIARRKLVDAARRRGRRPEVLEADLSVSPGDAPVSRWAECPGPDTPEAALERQETVAAVRRLVLQLPEAQREALWLRCVDQLSLAETARVLRRSENAIKGLLRRAKAALTERLTAEDAPSHQIPEPTYVEPSLSNASPAAPCGD